MATTIRINDIASYDGQEVTLEGWIYARTGKGKLQFIRFRDGTGIVQCVAFRPELGDEPFAELKALGQESSLRITGTVRADERAPGIPGGYEVGINSFEIVQATSEYPITPKEHGVEFLMDNRHLWLRSQRQWAILRVRTVVKRAIIDYLDDNGFVNLDTPIITPSAAEGTSTLFSLDYHGETAYLAQTGQLYNEANIFSFGKVYCFGPTFRAEKSKTRRHLSEFWMVEPEVAFCDLDQLMELEENFVSYIVQTVLANCKAELEILERDISHLERVTPPFPRISYDEAISIIKELYEAEEDPERKKELAIEWGDDFGSPHETELTKLYEKPLFVYGYPSAVKAFYMEPWPDRPEVCKSVDLLAPEGYGEIIGGSERMSDPDLLVEAIKKHDLPIEPYQWYVDLRKYGSVPHSGFGLGLERTVTWICGINHLRETGAFTRTINRLYP